MANKTHAVALLLMCTAILTSAQQKNEKPVPLKHNLKVYEDKERNRLFWPIGKEFWVRLAESPDSGAPSYLLSQEVDSQEVEAGVKVENKKTTNGGIKLDVTGKQAIRWYNMMTGKNYKLRFNSDGEAPLCEIKLSAASLFVKNNVTYSGKGILCQLVSSDKFAGVDKSYISINNAQYAAYDKPITFDKEMKYTIYAYSVDNVGNVSTQSNINFVVDMSAPQTRAIATKGVAAGNKTILSSAHTITLQATDSLSGVKSIWYKFAKDKNPSLYNAPIELKKFKDGEEQALVFYSEDQVGNVEKTKQIIFIIDDTPPVGKIAWEGDAFNLKDQVVVSSRTMFKIEAKDARSNIQEMSYSVNKNPTVPFKAPFCIVGEPGKYQISARAVDKSGNENAKINLNVVLDSKAPKSTHSFVGAMHKNEYTLWITPKTKIKLDAQDDLSGIKAIEYSFEGDTYVAYKEPFSINKEGLFILKYRGVDNVNNREEDRMIAVVVDSSSPVIEETFSSKPIASEDKSIVRFKGGTMFFLKVMDDASGIKDIVYLINGGRDQKYTGPVQFTKDGTYNVEVRAKDNLGNEQRKMLKFAIEK